MFSSEEYGCDAGRIVDGHNGRVIVVELLLITRTRKMSKIRYISMMIRMRRRRLRLLLVMTYWQVSLFSTLTHMRERMKSLASSLMSSQ